MLRALAAAGVAAALASAPAASGTGEAEPRQGPGSLAVLADAPGVAAAARRAGGRLIGRRLRIWRVPTRSLPALQRLGIVRSAEPELPRTPVGHLASGDELVPAEWWVPRVGADRAEPPGPGVPLTIIDAGLDLTHPEFAARPQTEGLNEQTITTRSEFHGTAVASVAAAPADGRGLVGVYPAARLLSWDAAADGRGLTSGDVVEGVLAAAARGRGIVNLSLGGERSQVEAAAIAEAFARGLIVVAAAGNEGAQGSPPSYPASLPHVVTVGATAFDDTVPAFSSRSRALDVAAPGVEIPFAVPVSLTPEGYGSADGTSFATPIVAGALAWAWTARPDLEKTQLLELLRRSARDIGPPGRDDATGFGLLDIPALLTGPAPPRDPFEPNDDLGQAQVPAGTAPRSPLTTRARAQARVLARLDVADDPRDVYPLWVPARRTATAVLRTAGPDLRLLGTRPRTLTARRTVRRGVESLAVTNRGSRGRYVYLNAFVPLDARPRHVTYLLSITTGRARP